MPGLVPGIHVLAAKTWMAGTSPAMTKERFEYACLRRNERNARGNPPVFMK
jgi:hypothetical protein